MGLFDRLFSQTPSAKPTVPPVQIYNEDEAFIGILFCCLYADGEASEEEIDAFSRYLVTRPAFRFLPIVDIYRKFLTYYMQVKDIASIVALAMPMISENRKPQLFATAVDFVLADGVVDAAEQKLLEDLQAGLQVDETLARQIIEVLLIKNSTVL
ncbi:tellurite resistance TerB family protein [Spirosoma sp. SC4-14]|uniref:tellurite resistance TerB family protein n=1 Tax=Spirosoma sp. SC4-14 TaxID=3128900 RepID=UPI0030D6200B